jgi:hypothetical protein
MIFVFSKISNNRLYPVLISFVILKSLVFFLVKRAGTRKMEEPCPDKSAFAQAEQAHPANKEKQSVPAGERPVNLIVCGFLQGASGCWVFVKQFSRNDTATACQDWLRVPG